jgi:hypothetical protein
LIGVGVAAGSPNIYVAFPDAYIVAIEPLIQFRSDLEEILAAGSTTRSESARRTCSMRRPARGPRSAKPDAVRPVDRLSAIRSTAWESEAEQGFRS